MCIGRYQTQGRCGCSSGTGSFPDMTIKRSAREGSPRDMVIQADLLDIRFLDRTGSLRRNIYQSHLSNTTGFRLAKC
jgi:hypothetical protein